MTICEIFDPGMYTDEEMENMCAYTEMRHTNYRYYMGDADILVKGRVNSDDFLKLVLKYHNLKKNKLTHCFIIQNVKHDFFLTDSVINPYPTPKDKITIVENAINFYSRMNNDYMPDIVNLLTPNGHISPSIQESLDNAALCEYLRKEYDYNIKFDYKQLDYCLDSNTRYIKGKTEGWGKNVDIIVVNNLSEGNSILKSFLVNGSHAYGYVLGADIPVILNSRSNLDDNDRAVKLIL